MFVRANNKNYEIIICMTWETKFHGAFEVYHIQYNGFGNTESFTEN